MTRSFWLVAAIILALAFASLTLVVGEVNRLEDELVALQTTLEVEESLSAAHRERVSHLRSEVASLTVALEETEAEVAALEEDNAALTAKLKTAEDKNAALRERAAVTPSRSTAPSSGWSSAKASWYGPGFYGRKTASGAVLTQGMMNVAHKSMAFGTKIQFEYKGKTATAVVNDRGPFIAGRVFDLGPGTAAALGFSGVGTVRYRVLGR
jgi:rare lipoprotein A (peptidoglycan hydrolase)